MNFACVILFIACVYTLGPIELNETYFRKHIVVSNSQGYTTYGNWFILFYTLECKSCRVLLPLFNNYTTSLNMTGYRYGRIDCYYHSSVCEMFNLEGYPALRAVYNNTFSKYNQPFTKENIFVFLVSQDHTTGIQIPIPPTWQSKLLGRAKLLVLPPFWVYEFAKEKQYFVLSVILFWLIITNMATMYLVNFITRFRKRKINSRRTKSKPKIR